MEQKRILIFEAYPFFSGAQRITLNVCKILKQNNFHITLLLADDRFGNIKKNFELHVDEIKYLNVYSGLLKYGDEDSWFSKKTILKSVFLGLVPLYFKSIKAINTGKYDFLYCCDPRGATMMLASAGLFRKKAILHFHGMNRLPGFLSKLFTKIFDNIICVSKDVADSLPESPKKIVVYNGIDFLQYENTNVSGIEDFINQKTGNSRSIVRFLYVGAIRPQKGLHHVVHSFKAVTDHLKKTNRDAMLFISGDAKAPEEIAFKEVITQFTKENGIKDKVVWLGWNSNVLGWMKCCDYFLFSSIKKEKNNYQGFGEYIESSEGLPTVLIESSLCSLYSIASDVTGVKEVITPYQNGSIYDASGEGLTKCIIDVLDNNREFKSFAEAEKYKLEVFEEKILNILS